MGRGVLLFGARDWCILGLMNLWIPFLCLVVTPPNHNFLPPCKQATENFVGKKTSKTLAKRLIQSRQRDQQRLQRQGVRLIDLQGPGRYATSGSWTVVTLEDYTAPATQPPQTVQADIHAQCASMFDFLGYSGHLEFYVKCLSFQC